MKRWIWILWFVSASLMAIEKPVVDALTTPTLLLGQGRYAQAADSFHLQSNIMLTLDKQLGTQAMWQAAGLAEGLAAISAEKDHNPIAYEYWANSVRYFLMAGSNWESLQTELHQEFEQANTRLQSNVSVGDAGVVLNNHWLQLFTLVEVWQDKLNYFGYKAPSSDLASSVIQSSANKVSEPKSSGTQLKQFSPKKQLQLDGGFRAKQTFDPTLNVESSEQKSDSVGQESAPSTQPTDAQSNSTGSSEREETQPKKNSQNTEASKSADPKTDNPPKKPLASSGVIIGPSQTQAPVRQTSDSAGVTVVTPIDLGGNIIEHDHANMPAEPSASPTDPIVKSKEQQISRSNLDSQSTSGVKASQRRSFAPVAEPDQE